VIAVMRLVAAKDLRIEARSRVLLWRVLPFGVMALVLAGLALGPARAGSSGAAPGLFYLVVLFVTLLATGRAEAIERAAGTRASVATLGLDPAGVFLGKSLALAVELLASAAVLLCGAVVLLHAGLAGTLRAAPSVALTVAALAAAGTMYGALTGGGAEAPTLLPILALPAFAPLLIAGERSYHAALAGGGAGRWWLVDAVALVAYLGAGIVLYGVLEES
jgi:heme exporter protein B